MTPCPVCEHPQAQGTVCDVCGKSWAPAAPVSVHTDLVEGLDTGRFVSGRLPEADAMPDLERTVAPAVGEVSVAPVQDLDMGRSAPVGTPTPLEAARACRYCKKEQPDGLFCDQCGMRLPTFPKAAVQASPSAMEKVRCRRCSERVLLGARCPSCGEPTLVEA
ncbi:MAG: hypothetical protein ACKVPX_04575 [Myxococcaceae bacterium]